MYPKGEKLHEWKEALPKTNRIEIEVVALQNSVNSSINAPRATEIGRADNLIGLSLEMPSYFEYFDFSYCRNLMDSEATGEWILHLDSDERIINSADEFADIILALEKSNADAGWVSIAGISHEELGDRPYAKRYNIPAMRLHKKSSGLKWSGICHETLDIETEDIFSADSELFILHSGYVLEKEEMTKKLERNAKLMMREYMRKNSQRNWSYLVETFSLIKNNTMR
jgi:glycosyltransferase involved in cell wall biosynthesis